MDCEFGQRNSGNYQEMAIEDDDVVCLPRDEVHPLIIRAHEQHWAIVSTLTCDSGDNVFCFTEEEAAKLVEKDPASLLLVWDWQSYPRNSPVSGYRPGHDTNDEYWQPVLPGYLNRGIKKLDFALSLYMVQSTLKFVSIVESVEQLLKSTLESREAIDLGGYQSEILELIGQQKYGWAALDIAAEHGHKAVVKLIIHRGEVDLNSKDAHFAETPLSQAARCGQETVARLLLDTGKVDPNSRGVLQYTPLHRAAQKGDEAIVALLLGTSGVNPDTASFYGSTPLHEAITCVHEAIITLLLRSGRVDPNACLQGLSDQKTALQLAESRGHWQIAKLLLDTGKVDASGTRWQRQT